MLWQPSLSKRYLDATPESLAADIEDRRHRLGEKLVILGHHYQVDDVIEHADFTGDSLKLSQLAAKVADERPVEHVVFCGVHFMAETADILTPDHVKVILPDLSAGCSMADMADHDDTVDAWNTIHEAIRLENGGSWNGRVIPITYVNSTAAIKAFVGEHGGACCTSSNADRVFAWALNGGDTPRAEGEEIKILFLPDQHLGRNTAAAYGIDVATRTCVYDPKLARRGEPFGGPDSETIANADVILWAGHCSVHKLFRPEHCAEIREANAALPASEEPTRIMVHPECAKEVVDLADESGSTEAIIRTIEASPAGAKWAVGTETHLVNRLRKRMAERDVEVRLLSDCQCLCTTMYRIDRRRLLWVLDGLCGIGDDGQDIPPVERNVIAVHPEVASLATAALDRMLALSAPAANMQS
ncbi:MAG: quinolinate synthase [Phycisphaerae bacterium]|nr:quinolinate synthase [Phycisphaerae bacterium]